MSYVLQELYKDAAVIADCDAMPYHTLVCFEAANFDNMTRAISAFESHYQCQLGEPMRIDDKGAFVGFWPPKMIEFRDPDGNARTETSKESAHLHKAAFRGDLVIAGPSTCEKDLRARLESAIDRALVARYDRRMN